MIIEVLKPTNYKGTFYRKGKEYVVENEVGQRWVTNGIAREVAEKPKENYTVAELREIAKAKGIKGYSSMSKAGLENVCLS
jgi:hypothetical protein